MPELTPEQIASMEINYDLLPETLRPGVKRYIELGIPPGSFLQAVIANDLQMACARADCANLMELPRIVRFFYNEAPSPCWGSPEALRHWVPAHWHNQLEV